MRFIGRVVYFPDEGDEFFAGRKIFEPGPKFLSRVSFQLVHEKAIRQHVHPEIFC